MPFPTIMPHRFGGIGCQYALSSSGTNSCHYSEMLLTFVLFCFAGTEVFWLMNHIYQGVSDRVLGSPGERSWALMGCLRWQSEPKLGQSLVCLSLGLASHNTPFPTVPHGLLLWFRKHASAKRGWFLSWAALDRCFNVWSTKGDRHQANYWIVSWDKTTILGLAILGLQISF